MKKTSYILFFLSTSLLLTACGSSKNTDESGDQGERDSKEIIQEIQEEEVQGSGEVFLIETLPLTSNGASTVMIKKS
jgi:major membrane immunogen (membrane-anchored lipoprotein)